MTNPPPELTEAMDRAQAFLAEVRMQLGPNAGATVAIAVLLCEWQDSQLLHDDLYSHACLSLAAALAQDWRYVMRAMQAS